MLKIIVRLNICLGANFFGQFEKILFLGPFMTLAIIKEISLKEFAPRQKLHLTMIFNIKILEFNHTLRKTWHFEV